eukprot:CAMPEP_0198731420 /NCGR_PEP_ID=MMETSP1475-20131203/29661_1 /TAXON_ID= ORGANISM="Unidentified sp., Strain CCMP1999" /NCGR_SAMPLE_ID=MMETSP1475 /ASSEMBLY_ACC=CAM_ASM_001111 /LENGTH=603 /DNA_ID=CAMNT_0044494383 /DNA_START=18 /DNA_END=1826 /DNA_ORIENTATION=-
MGASSIYRRFQHLWAQDCAEFGGAEGRRGMMRTDPAREQPLGFVQAAPFLLSKIMGTLFGKPQVNLPRNAAYYKEDDEPSRPVGENDRQPGRFSFKYTLEAARLADFCRLEDSSLYWRTQRRDIKDFKVVGPSQMSVGLRCAEGVLPELETNVISNFLPSSYDTTFDDGQGTVRSGIVKERRVDTDLLILSNEQEKIIVVVWEGTETKRDVLTDISFFSTKWKYGPDASGLRVHSGFASSFETVAPTLISTVKDLWKTNNYNRIACVGHSLGGALAAVNAHAFSYALTEELSKSDLPEEERLIVYTLGAPSFCNWNFQKDFHDRIPHCYRIVNDEDIVPRLSVPGRYHVGLYVLMDEHRMHFMPSDKLKRDFRADRTGLLSERLLDHAANQYLEFLLGHRFRLLVSEEQDKDIDRAFVALSENTDQFEVSEGQNKDLLNRRLRINTSQEVSSSSALNILRNAFGGDTVSDGTIAELVYFASKCVPTHQFVPSKGVVDISPIRIHNFREAVWYLVADPDDKARQKSKRLSQLRKVFDYFDKDLDGLMTASEFSEAVKLGGSESSTSDPEAQLNIVFREMYKEVRLEPRDELIPTEMSFVEFKVW